VQIVHAAPPNQPHRADVAKLLVRRSARRRGVARVLMERLEIEAAREKKTLLVLARSPAATPSASTTGSAGRRPA
jgi:GNAT superfamily N-acetyltransferase